MKKFNEILRLDAMLNKKGIPHEIHRLSDGYQIYNVDGCPDFDVIEFSGSYGSNSDLLEIMGLLTSEELKHDSVVGGLSAREVMNRIEKNRKLAGDVK